MANNQHMNWLTKGVNDWNVRRQKHEFLPDLSFSYFNELDLSVADLSDADMREAVLGMWAQGEAIAEACDLVGANLQNADLRLSYLNLVDVADANFSGANVSSVYYAAGSNPHYRRLHKDEPGWWHTDLRDAKNLTQDQVNQMIGDTGVLLPTHLSRPENWKKIRCNGTEFTPNMHPRIFLNYRRTDSEGWADRIFSSLVDRFGEEHVFLDVNSSIPIGRPWAKWIEESVSSCDLMPVLIGHNWASSFKSSEGDLSSHDYVAFEIAMALKRHIPVVPLMLGSAVIPKLDELPDEVRPILEMQAARIGLGSQFNSSIDALIDVIPASLSA